MTNEIHINQWKQFCDETSRDKLDWQTKVEVISAETGAQILSEGLPFGGLVYEDKNDSPQIEIILGRGTEHHQMHTILAPSKVHFRRTDEHSDGIVEIEEANDTKTLIYLTEPSNASTDAEESKVTTATAN